MLYLIYATAIAIFSFLLGLGFGYKFGLGKRFRRLTYKDPLDGKRIGVYCYQRDFNTTFRNAFEWLKFKTKIADYVFLEWKKGYKLKDLERDWCSLFPGNPPDYFIYADIAGTEFVLRFLNKEGKRIGYKHVELFVIFTNDIWPWKTVSLLTDYLRQAINDWEEKYLAKENLFDDRDPGYNPHPINYSEEAAEVKSESAPVVKE